MARLLPLLLTLTAWSCATTPPVRVVWQEPDLYTPRHQVPLYLRHNMMLLAPLVADYIDAVHDYLATHKLKVSTSTVTVYPKGGLWLARDGGVVGKVVGHKRWGSNEVKIAWDPDEGLPHYAEIRLEQAHWGASTRGGYEHRDKIAKAASAYAKQVVASRY